MRSLLCYSAMIALTVFLSLEIQGQTIDILEITKTDETCNTADDGTITIRVTGGTKPYVYHINDGEITRNSSVTYDTVFTFTNVWAANWIVFVGDFFNIPDFGGITVNQPAPITISAVNVNTISCAGSGDGEINVTANGESGSYIYILNPGAISAITGTFTGLSPDTYTVTVTDATGCTTSAITDPINLADPLPITVNSASVTDITCNGLNDGKIDVTGSGGTGLITYTLNPGAIAVNNSGSFTGLNTGIYTVNLTDENSCPSVNTAPLIVSEPLIVSGNISSQTNLLCFGSGTGSVTVDGSGGTAPYTYNIDGGIFGASGTFNDLIAGAHTVQVKDANGCTADVPVTIIQPASAVSGSITSQTNLQCFGIGSGSVTIAGAGGTDPYTYNIDGGLFGASGTFSGLATGAYIVQVKDDNGCTDDVPVNITQPAVLSGNISGQTNVLCFGSGTGSVTVTGAGGTTPYSFNIDGSAFQPSGTFSDLAAGAYTVQVADDNNCTADVAVTITQPASSVSGSITDQTDILCFGSATGSVTISGADGTGGYTYNIDGGAFGASGIFSGLTAGAHTVQVMDANSCTTDVAVNILQPATAVSGNITSQTDLLCFETGTGSVTVEGSGGTGAYTYNIDGGAFGAIGTFTGLALGNHTVQVADANSCLANVPVTITQPAVLGGIITEKTNVLCFGMSTGSFTVEGDGGTAPYTFKMGSGPFGATATFSGLSADDYTVKVKDDNGCTSDVEVTITEPAELTGSITGQTNVLCFGSGTGAVTVAGAGGTIPSYTYNIDGGAFSPSGTFSGLAAGAHTVQVSDANNCTADVAVNILAPADAVSGNITSQTNVLCFGSATGSVTVSGAGGTAPYIYNIDGGAFDASGTFNSLTAGPHTVQISDDNGCLKDVAVTITQPATAVSGNITSQTNLLCFGSGTGSVTVDGSDGTGPYTYNIDGGAFGASGTFGGLALGDHTVQVADANNCLANVPVTITQPTVLSGSISAQTNVLCFGTSTGLVTVAGNGGTTPYTYNIDGGDFGISGTFSGLAAGVYTVQVKDDNGCTDDVPVNITQPEVLSGNISGQTNVLCFGLSTGAVTVAGAGGTTPYSYNIDGSAFQPSGTFSDLAAGAYIVQVADDNNCTADVAVSITQPAEALSGNITSQTNVLCFETSTGSVTVTGAGGTAPYTYSFEGGPFVASGTFSSLADGVYTIQVKDDNGCTANVPVTITQPEILTSDITKTDITCNGLNNGNVTITASGGTSPYNYQGVPFAYQVSNVFVGLTKNTFTFNTKDSNGCLSSNIVTITEPLAIFIQNEVKIDNNICYGDSLGEIRIEGVTGGVSPYQYSINGGLNFYPSGIFQNLPAGNYLTVVRDANDCLKTGNTNSISEPDQIIINNYTQIDVTDCFGNLNGQVAIEAVGGTGTLTYDLDGEENNTLGFFNSVGGGNHVITVSDTRECSIDTTVTLAQPVEIVFSGLTITDVTGCNGDSNGAINALASGGTGPYLYSFNGGDFQLSGNHTGLSAGNYSLAAKDANLCVKDTIITISEPDPVSILSQTSVNVSCFAADNGSISIIAAGGSGTYTYVLNPGATETNNTGSFTSLVPGTYSVEVTDNLGCGPVNTLPLSISEPSVISRDSVITREITCNGFNDAEIHIYVSGGTSPFTYSIDDGGNYSVNPDSLGITPGTYHLSVLDSNSCLLNLDTLTFTEPSAINMVSENKLDITTCSYDLLGEIDFVVSGGTGSIQYTLDSLNWQASGHFESLLSGTYRVTATDQNLCVLSSSSLTINAPDTITAGITTTPELNEFNKGSVNITNAGGGTGTLVFSITGQAGTFSAQTNYTGLDAGTYPVVVRDDNNCFFELDAVVSFVPSLNVIVTLTDSDCNGDSTGSISMVSSNGTPPVEYSIDDSASWVSSGSFTDLGPGTYYLFVRDGQNRYFQDTILITEPSAINILGNTIPASCSSFKNDGAIDVNVSGGTSPYTYLWARGETTQDIENLKPGKYSITVTDSKACSNEKIFDLTALISVVAFAGVDTAVCSGIPFILNGQGGPVMSWSPPEGLSNPNISNPVVTLTENASYILTVTGFDDCLDIDTIHISVRPDMGLVAGNDTTVIKKAEIILDALGGPFETYRWEPASGLVTPDQSSTLAHPLENTTFIVTAFTEFGCAETDTTVVNVIERLIVYDIFSPNGDGLNDYFEIDFADYFPGMLVEVYTRWGEKLFSSRGYSDEQRWNGTYRGKDVPFGTYYYVIVPYSGAEPITGPLTIVR